MKSIVMRLRTTGVLAAAFTGLLFAAPVVSQAQETTASIRGKVVDASGTPVANEQVVVTDMRTGVQRTYATNSSGAFFATRLSVGGPYEVAVSDRALVQVDYISLGDIYNVTIDLPASMDEVVVTGKAGNSVEVAAGPAATFSTYELQTAVSFNRDIVEAYGLDPRLNVDNEDDGFEVNCAGKHPRFNSVSLDGVSQNDRFGLNSNGYSTAVGMPFPYDGISQVAVELAPFDVTYGGFSACNINSVTKSGSNEWTGNVFYEYTNEGMRADSLGGVDKDFSTPDYDDTKKGFSIGGPIIKDRLFVFAAYEDEERPRFLARGYDGAGNGDDREWLSLADYNRINTIAQNVYGYDPGGLPSDGVQEAEKYMVRVDYNINDNHNAALIYNYFDGFQDRDSDGDDDEFEFANHFYKKGSESETTTFKLASQWTDAFSTEVFYSQNTMIDSQVTVGDQFFPDMQISINRDTVYLGADDSRQANKLDTESEYFKLSGQLLVGNHVLTMGYESEELNIFNQFVQHARGGEYDFFDDSVGNPTFCAALTAEGRRLDGACGLSGIDRFELGRPSRIYYGSGGGTNNPNDAAASFANTLNSVYLQDEFFWDEKDITIVAGLRYDWFDSSDRPKYNDAFSTANGIRNDANIDGVSILMPRVGFTWQMTENVLARGGVGLFSGGNPNVWLSNAWSNDGLSNVQVRLNNFGATNSVLDGSIPLVGPNPGYDIPQSLFDTVANTTAANASDSGLVLIDPNYEQPSEWKLALGATYDTPWWGMQADVDFLYTKSNDSAYYVDLSQAIVGQTSAGTPIYDYAPGLGRDNYMLTNSGFTAESTVISLMLQKEFDWGLDLMVGYAYTDAEDISPMTASTAGSNFDNTATLNVNNPEPATSNYVVPHRFTVRASWAKELFGELQTRVSINAYGQEGQPQTFVMQSSDLEGDGFFGRHPLYVPTGPNDPNVVFDMSSADQTAFFDFVSREGLSSGFMGRNSKHARWSHRMDLRVDQELPTFVDGVYGKAFLKIYNFSNFLNKDWGKVYDAQFFSVQVVDTEVDANGRFVYSDFQDRSLTTLLENRSLWSARVGIEFSF